MRTGHQAELLCQELPNIPAQASDKPLSLESRITSVHDHAQVTNAKQLTEKLRDSGKSLVPILEGNLVDKVWGADRPAPPKAPLRIHKMEHAGQSVQDKLIKLRKDMQGRLALWVSLSYYGHEHLHHGMLCIGVGANFCTLWDAQSMLC